MKAIIPLLILIILVPLVAAENFDFYVLLHSNNGQGLIVAQSKVVVIQRQENLHQILLCMDFAHGRILDLRCLTVIPKPH
ncbi:hypothetical protein AQUCO_06000045v1 [Aquilegia coerulea]|uniref:Uncharacterized protein n=1 Tax=Aquilegia coerulea TaxID=218851 RepID=A0A2G5CDN5_AQUCA|nr:hypothetical protein AQUCO_06000045v1 [Aquilegia coerulea]